MFSKLKVGKKVVVGASLAVVLGLSVTTFALAQPNKKQDDGVDMKQTPTINSQQIKEEAVASVPEEQVVQQAVAPVPSAPSAASETPSQPQPENPLYGPDPSNPGYMRVFDKQAVMAQAGISTEDSNYASAYINRQSGWAYKEDGSHTLCGPVSNASAASDWKTNPVTQMKVCNEKAIARGGWAAFYKDFR